MEKFVTESCIHMCSYYLHLQSSEYDIERRRNSHIQHKSNSKRKKKEEIVSSLVVSIFLSFCVVFCVPLSPLKFFFVPFFHFQCLFRSIDEFLNRCTYWKKGRWQPQARNNFFTLNLICLQTIYHSSIIREQFFWVIFLWKGCCFGVNLSMWFASCIV